MAKDIDARDRKTNRRDKMKSGGPKDRFRLGQHRSGNSPREQAMQAFNREADREPKED